MTRISSRHVNFVRSYGRNNMRFSQLYSNEMKLSDFQLVLEIEIHKFPEFVEADVTYWQRRETKK